MHKESIQTSHLISVGFSENDVFHVAYLSHSLILWQPFHQHHTIFITFPLTLASHLLLTFTWKVLKNLCDLVDDNNTHLF